MVPTANRLSETATARRLTPSIALFTSTSGGDCGLSYTTGQATIARSAIVACRFYSTSSTRDIRRLTTCIVHVFCPSENNEIPSQDQHSWTWITFLNPNPKCFDHASPTTEIITRPNPTHHRQSAIINKKASIR